jgi:hypothetical protein
MHIYLHPPHLHVNFLLNSTWNIVMCWIKYVVVREYYILYNTPTVHDYYQNEMDNQIMKRRLFPVFAVSSSISTHSVAASVENSRIPGPSSSLPEWSPTLNLCLFKRSLRRWRRLVLPGFTMLINICTTTLFYCISKHYNWWEHHFNLSMTSWFETILPWEHGMLIFCKYQT